MLKTDFCSSLSRCSTYWSPFQAAAAHFMTRSVAAVHKNIKWRLRTVWEKVLNDGNRISRLKVWKMTWVSLRRSQKKKGEWNVSLVNLSSGGLSNQAKNPILISRSLVRVDTIDDSLSIRSIGSSWLLKDSRMSSMVKDVSYLFVTWFLMVGAWIRDASPVGYISV